MNHSDQNNFDDVPLIDPPSYEDSNPEFNLNSGKSSNIAQNSYVLQPDPPKPINPSLNPHTSPSQGYTHSAPEVVPLYPKFDGPNYVNPREEYQMSMPLMPQYPQTMRGSQPDPPIQPMLYGTIRSNQLQQSVSPPVSPSPSIYEKTTSPSQPSLSQPTANQPQPGLSSSSVPTTKPTSQPTSQPPTQYQSQPQIQGQIQPQFQPQHQPQMVSNPPQAFRLPNGQIVYSNQPSFYPNAYQPNVVFSSTQNTHGNFGNVTTTTTTAVSSFVSSSPYGTSAVVAPTQPLGLTALKQTMPLVPKSYVRPKWAYPRTYNRQDVFVAPLGVTNEQALKIGQASAAFRAIDNKMKGQIKKQDFEKLLDQIGWKVCREDAKKMFKMIDYEKCGKITEREFTEFWMSL